MKRSIYSLFILSSIFISISAVADVTTPYTNTMQANIKCEDIHTKCENNEISLADCTAQMQQCYEDNAKKEADAVDKIRSALTPPQTNTPATTPDDDKPAWHYGPP